MSWHRSSWLVICGCACLGCAYESNPGNPTPMASSQGSEGSESGNKPDGDHNVQRVTAVMLDHPEYANWSRFPVGTSITRKRTVTNEFGEVKVTTRMWLESKSEKEVEVGSQINVARPNEPLEENPDSFTKYPAQFQLPEGMDPNFFLLPTANAKKAGEEVVVVDGREVTAEVYEWEDRNETGPMDVKLWRSIDVPGRIVRQEMITRSSQTKTIENVEAFKTPSSEDKGGD
ncbi:MAG: hypothetical protein MUF23_02730 [Pirellula sp.]|nr:hypothetical protein [Pirellula sp.]